MIPLHEIVSLKLNVRSLYTQTNFKHLHFQFDPVWLTDHAKL